MRLIIGMVAASIIFMGVSTAMAKSPAERARLKQSTDFGTKTTYTAPSYENAQKPVDPVILDGEEDYVYEKAEECPANNRFVNPFLSALGGIAGSLIGGSIGAGSVGGQAASVLGGTATRVATNEAIREACK